MIGFSEYTNPSVPARKFRKQSISGFVNACSWKPGCSEPGAAGGARFEWYGSYVYAQNGSGVTNTQFEDDYAANPSSPGCDVLSTPGAHSLMPQDFSPANTTTAALSISGTSKVWDYPGTCSYASQKFLGQALCVLSEPDTEKDAETRVSNPIAGDSNVVYRTSRTTGFTFEYRKVNVSARFQIPCPGDYSIFVIYTEKPHSGGVASDPKWKFLGQKQILRPDEIYPFNRDVQIDDGPFTQRDMDYAIIGVELQRTCEVQEPGAVGSNQGSVRTWFGLGRAPGDTSAGQLRLDAEVLESTVYTPAALVLGTPQPVSIVEPVRDSAGTLRQVKSPQTLADIVVLDGTSYELRFYDLSQVGIQNATTRIYALTGSPFVTYKVENPDTGQTVRLRITETRGSLTKITEYAYNSASSTWTFTLGSGLRKEMEVATIVGGDKVKTKTISDSTDQVISKIARTYHTFAWNEELIREVLDPDGAALTTQYEFYDSVATSDPNYAHLKQRTNPNGSWERYTYDSTGRILKTIRPFLDASPATSDESLCHVTESIYDSVPDADGDSNAELRTTILERTLGQETARRYRIDWSKSTTLGSDVCSRRSDIVCVAAGTAWDATANLVTETLVYASGAFKDRTRRIVNPDNTTTLTSYALDGSNVLTTTVKSGAPNSAHDDVVDGRRIITSTSALGQVVSETAADITSNLVITSWSATELDSVGRPTRLDYADGTYMTRSYACCGLSSERDRSGLITTYTYDALGHQTTVTRLGITTKNDYDADGRVKTVTRIGTDNSEIVQQNNVYDLAGRLVSHRDALNRPTSYAEAIDSGSGTRTLTLEIAAAAAAPKITSAPVTAASVGTSFDYQILATGSPTSYGATGLPAGLSINSSSGVISGTPTTAGTAGIGLTATNAGGTGSLTLTLTVSAAGAAPIFTSTDSTIGTVGASFSHQTVATNTPTAYAASDLPAGLVINTTSGLISGTPLAAGTSVATITATNATGTGARLLTFAISAAITSAGSASATTGTSFSYQISANNSPASYAATGLPAGVSLNATTGLISGTPTAAGTFSITLTANAATATGETTRTTTNPDGGTSIEVSARDGSRLSIAGTAVAPHAFDYGVDSTGIFTKDTLIGADTNNQPTTTEWVKSYTDFAGRAFKTVYPDAAAAQSYFNAVGQLNRQVDPDGVTTLFAYNARGEQEVTALDLNGNTTIDYTGTDRISKTVNVVATKTEGSATYTVRRATTTIWETDNEDTSATVSISEQSSDGLRSWQTIRGLTTKSVTVFDGSGGRTVTTTTPDTAQTVQVYAGDRLDSTTFKTGTNVQLAATTYGYDAHGRLHTTTDARNGTTTFAYFDDDQMHTVVTPDPDTTRSGAGYDAQTTTYAYDDAGRVQTVTQPDTTVVNTTYWPTSAVKRTWGTRTYPVEYTYDPQGRVKTLTTWQNFAGDSGKAVTTWNYDAQRGFLLNKHYDDNTGPSYTYQASGRLHTRTWVRTPTITTTYGYNPAGDLETTDYSDSTPDITLAYDRSGRPKTVADAAGSRTLSYHTSGQLEDETYTSGLLSGLTVDRSFDSLNRLSGIAALTSLPSTISSATYSYDAASRLDTITFGANTAVYGYVTNSALVDTVTFKNASTTRLTTTKTYDKLTRLTSIANAPSAASALSHAYTYNSANQRTRATREDSAYWGYSYDALGQVTSAGKFLADDTAAVGLAYGYTYDDIGNRKTAIINGQTATYTPSALNQYSQRTVPGMLDVLGAASATAAVTIAVNGSTPEATTRQGETFYKQLTSDNASTAQYPSLKITGVKNLVGPNGEDAVTEFTRPAYLARTPEIYTHDSDGNLTDDARWHYTWDAENRLVAVETATLAAGVGVPRQKLEFAYDGQGRRVEKKVSAWNTGTSTYQLANDTRFIYDGWNLLADLNGLASNATICTYVWGLDLSGSLQGAGGVGGLVFSTLAGQSMNYAYAYDGNGNVSALLDMTTGAKSASYDYDAFGETVTNEGHEALVNPFRFSTKYADIETGHLYYGYRYYAPDFGRWLSRDSIQERGGVTLYGFVENNGVNTLDYFGLSSKSDIDAGTLIYSVYCGWIDWNHTIPTSATALWNAVKKESGPVDGSGFRMGYEQTAHKAIYTVRFGAAFWVKSGLSIANKESVALGMFKYVSFGFESEQAVGISGILSNSGFSEEDLPSDLIGFYRAVKGYSISDIQKMAGVISKDESKCLWDRIGGLKQRASWSPTDYNAELAKIRGSAVPGMAWPSKLNSIQDSPRGSYWDVLVSESLQGLGGKGSVRIGY